MSAGSYMALLLTTRSQTLAYPKVDGLDELSCHINWAVLNAPALFIHGDADGFSAMESVKTWEKMRSMGIQSEVHTLATRQHSLQRETVPGTGSYNFMDRFQNSYRSNQGVKICKMNVDQLLKNN